MSECITKVAKRDPEAADSGKRRTGVEVNRKEEERH